MNSKPIHAPQKKSAAVTPTPSPNTPTPQDTCPTSTQSHKVVGSIDELVKLRNDSLIELYCVSRLSDLLDFTGKSSLEDEIHAFLSKNDIREKNSRFQVSTLPNVEETGGTKSATRQNSADDNKIGHESVTSSPASFGKPVTSLAATSPTLIGSSHSNKTKRVAADSMMSTGTARRVKRSKLAPSTAAGVPSTNRHPKKGSGCVKAASLPPLSTSSITEHRAQKSPSSSTSSAATVSSRLDESNKPVPVRSITLPPADIPAPAGSSNITKREPTQVDDTKEYKVPIVKSIRQQLEDTAENSFFDYYFDNNIDVKDNVYVVMGENVPSMLPYSTSLMELRYMAQTLPLINLLPSAYKALSTDIINNALNEARMSIVSSRIEELKRAGLWSLRQPKRFLDPDRFDNSRTHYSALLAEAKWMQTDFQEGLRYKIAVSMMLAREVMKYWKYGREACCIRVKTPIVDKTEDEQTLKAQSSQGNNINIKDCDNDNSVASSGQIAGAIDTEKLLREPSANADEILKTNEFGNQNTSAKEEQASQMQNWISLDDGYPVNPFKLTVSYDALNSVERNVIEDLSLYSGIPLSASAGVDVPLSGPKKSMFIPISESVATLDDDDFYKIVERQIVDDRQNTQVLTKKRGLFLGTGTSDYLRPPPVPSLRYLQYRAPTIWLPEDDKELVNNINTYSYNWELISAQMTRRPSKSYLSNVEKRTPWQCFERFVQLNEKFTFDDLKGPRSHLAQQWLIEAHRFQQRQNRRISPLGVGNDSIQRGNRRLRWASMFEAMRKSIKRREGAAKPVKPQVRKTIGLKDVKVPTPAEMSQLKAQRDEAIRRDMLARKEKRYILQQSRYQAIPAAQSRLHAEVEARDPQGKAGFAIPGTNSGGGTSLNSRRNVQKNGSGDNNGKNGNSSDDKSNKRQEGGYHPTRKSSEAISGRDIIELYSKKILAQKPEIPPETAWRIAENYYRSMQEQHQLQLVHQQQQWQQQLLQSQMQQQLQQQVSPQVKPQAAQQRYPLAQSQYQEQRMSSSYGQQADKNIQQNFIQGSSTDSSKRNSIVKTIKSPAPYEILQRFQK